MIDQRILLVEDDDTTREMLRNILEVKGYTIVECADGKSALEMYRANAFPVVITDIDMPIMDGNQLIYELKSLNDQQIIIVLTVHAEPEVIIDIMRKGVFDFSMKPLQSTDLLYKVARAFEIAELKKIKHSMEKEKVIKLQNQLEWFKWNESFIQRNYDRVEQTLFENLHTSFNQGGGFGALLTIVNLIPLTAVKNGDDYLITSGIFNLIRQNADKAEKTLNVFADINLIISNDFVKEKVSCADLYSLVESVVSKNRHYEKCKKQSLILSDKKPHFENDNVYIESGYITKAMTELIFNAYKFSEDNSSIFVLFDYQNSEAVALSIISKPYKNKLGFYGIPFEYENLVFEPFFRVEGFTFEQFPTNDFGLGLTVVEKIILKHGGNITVSNIIDYSDIKREPVVKVKFTFILPLAK